MHCNKAFGFIIWSIFTEFLKLGWREIVEQIVKCGGRWGGWGWRSLFQGRQDTMLPQSIVAERYGYVTDLFYSANTHNSVSSLGLGFTDMVQY